MFFFLDMDPPRATGQMKKVRVVNGRPVFYDPPEVKAARKTFCIYLDRHRPEEPLTGPLSLTVTWLFPKGKTHKTGEWKITRPDTDNLEKILKDCMTSVGFWKDDAQVCNETIIKKWSDEPGIEISVEEL